MRKAPLGWTVAASIFALLLLAGRGVAQVPKGFRAAEPDTLPQSAEVTCKIGETTYRVSLTPNRLQFTNQNEAEGVLREVLDYAGYYSNVITIAAAAVDNAEFCRSADPSRPDLILYNPAWFKAVYQDTIETWADRTIIAHELGHYALRHSQIAQGSNSDLELKADEYAGEILGKMAADWNQIEKVFKSKRMVQGSHFSHGSPQLRIAAAERGWRKGNPQFKALRARKLVEDCRVNSQKRNYQEAIDDCSAALEANPRLYSAYIYRAGAYGSLKRNEAAVADYSKALDLSNKDPIVYWSRGLAFIELKRIDDAIRDFTVAIDSGEALPNMSAMIFSSRGSAYFEKGEYEHALADYDVAISRNPKSPFHFYGRGKTLRELGKLNEALGDFNRAIELNNNRSDFYLARSWVLRKLGKMKEAESDEMRAVELKPTPK